MFAASTGITYGKEKNMIANVSQHTVTIFTMGPMVEPMWKTPLCMFFLPVIRLVRMGNMYEMLLIVTAVPRRELNAVDEPRYKQPKAAMMAVTAS